MILIGLGSNLGERECQLEQALQRLEQAGDLRIVSVSNLYETKPVGDTDQPEFLNMAARLETFLTPLDLLKRCLAVENEMGRLRTRRVRLTELILPHPEIVNRGFVLIPLNDIVPELMLENEKTVAEMTGVFLAGKQNDVRLWKKVSWDAARKCLV